MDFIIYGPQGFWVIEVKNSKSVSQADIRQLQSFKEEYKEATPLLLYRGEKRTTVNNILCIHCKRIFV